MRSVAVRSTSSFTVLVALLCFTPAGCKEGNPLSGDIAAATAAFDPDPVPEGVTERFISLRPGAIDGGRITLDVVATEVDEPVAGLAMRLTYPASFSRFVRCSDGDLLPPGPCHAEETAAGEVLVGRAVWGSDQATAVSGTRVVLRLEFLVFGVSQCAAPEACRIRIEGQNLGGDNVSALVDVEGDPIVVQWFSGVLRGE